MGGQSAGLIHATTQIIVSDIDRVGGRAKIPLPTTYGDRRRQSRVAGIPRQAGDKLFTDERLKKTFAGYAIWLIGPIRERPA